MCEAQNTPPCSGPNAAQPPDALAGEQIRAGSPTFDSTVPVDATVPDEHTVVRTNKPSIRQRLTSLLEVILCSGFPTQLLVTLALAGGGVSVLAPDGRLSLTYIAVLSAVDTALLLTLIFVFLRASAESATRLLLGLRSRWREALLGLALLPLAFLTVALGGQLIEMYAPGLKNEAGNPLAELLDTRANMVVFALVAVIAGGIREEVQRAFVLHRFEQHLGGALVGLIVFSTTFGLGHALQGWDATILTGLLGAFWAAVYLWRRSILAPAVCHGVFNLVEVFYHGLRT